MTTQATTTMKTLSADHVTAAVAYAADQLGPHWMIALEIRNILKNGGTAPRIDNHAEVIATLQKTISHTNWSEISTKAIGLTTMWAVAKAGPQPKNMSWSDAFEFFGAKGKGKDAYSSLSAELAEQEELRAVALVLAAGPDQVSETVWAQACPAH